MIKKQKSMQELINFSILNIDKPAEWTSFDVVNYMMKLFGIKKAGHFGTLDPLVTGVLPVCLGDACKIQELFMHREKTYIGVMKLHKPIEELKLKDEMKKFLGVINQLPPRKSAVKRKIRKRNIIKFELLTYDKEKKEASFIAEVEAGTYIRKLISDLGDKIGGAHMQSLRRIQAGLFSDKDEEFSSIEKIEKAIQNYKEGNEKYLREILIPAEIITKIIPVVEVKENAIEKLKHGSPLFDEMLVDEKAARKIINQKLPFAVVWGDKLIEIAKFTDRFEQKSILAKAECVLINQ